MTGPVLGPPKVEGPGAEGPASTQGGPSGSAGDGGAQRKPEREGGGGGNAGDGHGDNTNDMDVDAAQVVVNPDDPIYKAMMAAAQQHATHGGPPGGDVGSTGDGAGAGGAGVKKEEGVKSEGGSVVAKPVVLPARAAPVRLGKPAAKVCVGVLLLYITTIQITRTSLLHKSHMHHHHTNHTYIITTQITHASPPYKSQHHIKHTGACV